MNKIKIRIDVVSDVVCPWCYIGKRRLENALSRLPENYEVELSFLPFELNPDTPKSGVDHKSYLAEKFGSAERYDQLTDHVTNIGAGEGLKFDYDKQSVIPNTLDSHRLIQYARKYDKQPAIKEALMKAYFEEGIDLSKTENLVTIAVKAGLNEDEVRKLGRWNKSTSNAEFPEFLSISSTTSMEFLVRSRVIRL
jgi:predicted DsbA family dithiol-disulfide isomerase